MNAVSEIQFAVLPSEETPDFPSPSIIDSRRLLGPNFYSARPGALLEVRGDVPRLDALLEAWAARARELLDALGWDANSAEVQVRRSGGNATMFFAAAIDVLMTATEVNEQAWVTAESGGRVKSDSAIVATLRATATAERVTRKNLVEVFERALAKGLSPVFDDESLTVGAGKGAQTWPIDAVPAVDAVSWKAITGVPISLVTGSNGKTTTTRLVAAMWRTAGRVAGLSCSDGVWVEDDRIESGDYAGPAGARAVLRDPRIEAAVLETARGGVMRRGLAVHRANAAIITNIVADHFGEYGLDNLQDLAEAKRVVIKALGADGRLVLNADDPMLVKLARGLTIPISWFSVAPANSIIDAHAASGGDVAAVQDGRVMLHRGRWHDLGAIDAMPLTLRGAARHNVENILGACLLAVASGVPVQSLRATLVKFGSAASDNPGRLQAYRFGGATVLVDFAHNPDGLAALTETAKTIAATRRLLLLGQAGNRDDTQLRALVRAAWSVMPFDRVIVKEMPTLLRGRAPGELPRIFSDELVKVGLPKTQIEVVDGELAALRRAFAWARNGDLLVCPVHVEKAAVIAWLEQLRAAGWKAGDKLPGVASRK